MPLKSYLAYLCIALFLTTGVTFSKYITETTAGDSARVAEFGELILTEQNKPETYIFAPGFSIIKNPMIHFSGNEMSAYVFVEIIAESWGFSDAFGKYTYSYDSGKLIWEVNRTDWALISYDSGTKKAIFYKLVPPGEELNGVSIIRNNTITVSEQAKASELNAIVSENMDIVIKAYAIQSGGFENAESAWGSVKNKE